MQHTNFIRIDSFIDFCCYFNFLQPLKGQSNDFLGRRTTREHVSWGLLYLPSNFQVNRSFRNKLRSLRSYIVGTVKVTNSFSFESTIIFLFYVEGI